MLKLALVGVGHVSKYQFEAAAISGRVQFVDAYDVDPTKAASLPPGIGFYESLDTMVEKTKADLFVVATPNTAHYEVAAAIMRSGRSLLIEKPVCVSFNELESLLDLIQGQAVYAHVAFHAAFANDLLWWIEHQSDFSTGALIGFECAFFDPYLSSEGVLEPAARSLGGSLIDSGINALSVVGKLVEPSSLGVRSSFVTKVSPLMTCDQLASATILDWSKPTKGVGSIHTSWTLGLNQKTTLLQYENMRVLLHHSNECVYRKYDESEEWDLVYDARNGRVRLVNHYVNLFDDLTQHFGQGESNINFAVCVHRLLFQAISAQPLEYFSVDQ